MAPCAHSEIVVGRRTIWCTSGPTGAVAGVGEAAVVGGVTDLLQPATVSKQLAKRISDCLLIDLVHRALRSLRGAAVAVARIDLSCGKIDIFRVGQYHGADLFGLASDTASGFGPWNRWTSGSANSGVFLSLACGWQSHNVFRRPFDPAPRSIHARSWPRTTRP